MANHGGALQVTIENDVAFLTLDNPPVNILTRAMMDRISDALREISGNAGLKAVALRSTGKAFSAGADIGEHRPDQIRGMIEAFGRMFRFLDSVELPIVAAVNGPALGAGFELAMMADVILAGDRATFGQPEIRLGFFAPVAVARLPELVGAAKATEITCTGRTYSVGEMHACGLVSKVVPPDALEGELTQVLNDLRRASPLVMRLNVRTLKRLRGRPFAEALTEAERVFLDELMSAEDPVEGINSFYEKRPPVWRNR